MVDANGRVLRVTHRVQHRRAVYWNSALPSIADEGQTDHLTTNATDCFTFLSNPDIDLNSNLDPNCDPGEL